MTTTSKKRGNGLSTLALSLAGLLMLLLLSRKRANTSQAAQVIKSVLIREGISPRTADYWVAVSQHETGNFKSDLLQRANNLFGMKQPRQRLTLSKGETKGGYASYANLSDSVKDLVLYMQEFNYPVDFASIKDLVTFMKSKKYFEDDYYTYLNGVTTWYNKSK